MVLERLDEPDETASLALPPPVTEVLDVALAAGIDCLACAHEHVARRDDVGQRWLALVAIRYPDRDGDVVCRAAIRYGHQAVDAYQQLCPAVVERVDLSLGPERGIRRQHGIDVRVDSILGWVRLRDLA